MWSHLMTISCSIRFLQVCLLIGSILYTTCLKCTFNVQLSVAMVVLGSLIHTVGIMAGVYVKIATAPFAKFDEILGPLYAHKQPSYGDLLQK